MENIIIYKHGGEIFLGNHTTQKISYWKWYGKQKNQKYMYKGYRYFDDKKDIVIVYDDILWGISEHQKRRSNGFLGIKRYSLI